MSGPSRSQRLLPATVLASRATGTLLQFAVAASIGRLYGAELVGDYYIYVYWSNLLATIAGVGACTYVLRHGSGSPSNGSIRQVVRWGLGLTLLGTAFFGAAVLVLFEIIWPHTVVHAPALVIASALLALIRLAADSLKALGRPSLGLVAEFSLIPAFVTTAVLTTAVGSGDTLGWLFAGGCAFGALVTWSLLGWAVSRVPGSEAAAVRRPSIRELASYWGVSLMNSGLGSSPYVLLPLFFSVSQVGLFAVAHRLVGVSLTLLHALGAVYAPRFSRLFGQRLRADLARTYVQSQGVSALTYLPFLLVYLLLPRTVLSLFGGEFEAAAGLLVILAVGRAVNAACGLGEHLLAMVGRARQELANAAIWLALFAAGALLAGVAGSIEALAWAYAAALAGRAAVSLLLVRRVLRAD